MENGDLNVYEDLTFKFNDKFNGVFRNIVLEGTDGIETLEVFEVVNGSENPYTLEQKAEKGDSNVYSYKQENDEITMMIFSPSEDEEKTFRFKYTLKNVAVIHSDTAEFYYKYLGEGNETPIEYFTANLSLPEFDKEKIKIFAHGPLNGTINFTDSKQIRLEVRDVPTKTFIEARVLYPKDYTPLASKIGNNSLDNILKEEMEYIRDLEEKEVRSKANKSLFNNISIITLIIGIVTTYFFFRKNRRDPMIYENMNSIYPEEISPAEVTLFMNSMIDIRGLMATLFDLARREYITIDKQSSNDSEFKFTRKNILDNNLLEHERYLLDWLFNTVGNSTTVSTKDIDFYRRKHMRNYYREYNQWMKLVKVQLDSRNYSDKSNVMPGLITMLLSVPIFIIGIFSLINEAIYGIGAILVSILLFVLGIALMVRKSDKGYIQYGLWKDFKKEFDNYSNLDISIPKDKTLIYAIALGISLEKLNKRRMYYGYDYYPMYWGYWYFAHNNKKGGSAFEDSMNKSFYGNTGTSTPTSTNYGGGGGFSAGGGGGAGGGGAGGF
jgi:uncharacterized membrane protein